MQRRLKTVHIEFGRQLCGGPLQVVYLMRGLVERGHQVSLICAAGSGIEEAARSYGIDVCPIRVLSDLDPGIALRCYAIMHRIKPDVIHLHSRRGAELYGGLAARAAHIPAIILSRRIDDPIELDSLGRLKYVKLPNKVVAISNGIRNVLIQGGLEPSNVRLVRSAIIASEYQLERDRAWFKKEFGVPQDAVVIGSIGRLIPAKGHCHFIAAAQEILKEFPKTWFILLGDGPLRTSLEALAHKHEVHHVMVFAGFRDDIARIMPNLDLVAHPSLLEGLGVSLLQASSVGLPIVASEVGGIPEVIRHEHTGLLVPPGDHDAITQSVIRLLKDDDLARRLGENARRTVETEFDADSMVEGNIRVYFECLGVQTEDQMIEKAAALEGKGGG